MSRMLFLVIAIALAGLLATPASAWAASGYVYDAAGSVYIAANKKIAPRLAVKNDSVVSGTVIRTGDNSHAVLKFEDGQVVSMQANSTFQVREYYYEPRQVEKSNIVFSMFKGGMRFITGQIGQRNPKAFRLATPNATIGIHGTDFMVVLAKNATYSQVASGSISLTNAAGMTILNAGQTGLTSSATSLTNIVPAASAPTGTFREIAAILVPAPVPAPVPPPAAAATGTPVATTTTTVTVPASMPAAAAGGAAPGGAAASTAATAGGAATGVSATTIGIGIGVAAVVAAVAGRSSSTTQH